MIEVDSRSTTATMLGIVPCALVATLFAIAPSPSPAAASSEANTVEPGPRRFPRHVRSRKIAATGGLALAAIWATTAFVALPKFARKRRPGESASDYAATQAWGFRISVFPLVGPWVAIGKARTPLRITGTVISGVMQAAAAGLIVGGLIDARRHRPALFASPRIEGGLDVGFAIAF